METLPYMLVGKKLNKRKTPGDPGVFIHRLLLFVVKEKERHG